jgi:hypothetical protein
VDVYTLPLSHNTQLIVGSPLVPPPSSHPQKKDYEDSTEALLAKLIEGKHVIDDAIVNLYDDERAWGLSAVIGDILNINDNSDEPPFEHDTPSALLGDKRLSPLRWNAEQQPMSKATTLGKRW